MLQNAGFFVLMVGDTTCFFLLYAKEPNMKYLALLAAASMLFVALPGCTKDSGKTADAMTVKLKVAGMT